ncbi:MAG: hypothetical protein O6952_06860 [Planctomycetota bacterium]|nr:hypothetical protein [Planctomycetota bacterium]
MRFLLLVFVFFPAGPSSLFAMQEKPIPPESELTSAEIKALEKRIKKFYSTRRKVRCSSCKGKAYRICNKCKGQGKIYRYYPNTNKVDWDKTKDCGKCRTNGRYDCRRRSCLTGFEEKDLRGVFWDLRSPEYKEDLEGHLGVGDLYVTGFLKAVAIYNKHPKAEVKHGFTEIANDLGVDYDKFLRFVRERCSYKDLISPFSQFKILKTGYESKVRVREMRNGKVAREFLEYSTWIFSGDDWYLKSIRKGRI